MIDLVCKNVRIATEEDMSPHFKDFTVDIEYEDGYLDVDGSSAIGTKFFYLFPLGKRARVSTWKEMKVVNGWIRGKWWPDSDTWGPSPLTKVVPLLLAQEAIEKANQASYY